MSADVVYQFVPGIVTAFGLVAGWNLFKSLVSW